ncbi:MAG: serine/threonine-protein kinase [Thainema sp.]
MAVSTRLKRSPKYRILGLIGQGQFGQVFCAVHRKTGQFVALKNLDHYRFPTHKFLRELRFLLSLQHPNIVNCQSLEHTATGRYLVMDYCEGGTLRQLMNMGGTLTLIQKVGLIDDVLAGLQHAHSRGIIHCDIKPENILLTLKPGTWQAHISDFGIARLTQNESMQAGSNTGSPAYMAPERFYGQYSLLSDLYAVGVMLYELILGDRPFSGTPQELMTAHLNQPVVLPNEIPIELQTIVRTALQKLPARRFRSAADMLQALQSLTPQQLQQTEQQLALRSQQLRFANARHLEDWEIRAAVNAARKSVAVRPQSVCSLSSPLMAMASFSTTLARHTPSDAAGLVQHLVQMSPSECAYIQYRSDALTAAEPYRQQPISTPLTERVRELAPVPQGCFIIKAHAVEFFPWPSNSTSSASTTQVVPLQPTSVIQFKYNSQVVVHAAGHWLAALTAESAKQLQTCRWQYDLATQTVNVSDLRSHQLSLSNSSLTGAKLLPLDDRHLAVMQQFRTDSAPSKAIPSEAVSKASASRSTAHTQLQVFTRRDTRLGSIRINVPIEQAIMTTRPYRLLAVEQGNQQAIVLIDLKPFYAQRIGVGIVPVCLHATSWGYILAAENGEIVLINHDTEIVGRLAGPAYPSAIATFNGYGLLIATWNGRQGQLHTIDLRELDIDLIF